MTDRWLSVEEIAEYLGVSKDTVYAWINKRNMPAHRIGRLWKFKSEEVDAWVLSGGAAENENGKIALTKKFACFDLFWEGGGLTHGFILEGLPLVAGIDLDPACRFPY